MRTLYISLIILQLPFMQCTSEFQEAHHIAKRNEDVVVIDPPTPPEPLPETLPPACTLLDCIVATDCTGGAFSFCPCMVIAGYEWLTFTELCIDVDECALVDPDNVCTDKHSTCVNSPGTYECVCDDGYYPVQPDPIDEPLLILCQDIDECDTVDICDVHTCNNTNGGYECLCNIGYTQQPDQHTCLSDVANGLPPGGINECDTGNHECTHTCTPTDSGHVCECDVGYTLQDDGHTCLSDTGSSSNECDTGNNECTHTCTPTDDGHECGCIAGYELQDDMHTCLSDVYRFRVCRKYAIHEESESTLADVPTSCELADLKNELLPDDLVYWIATPECLENDDPTTEKDGYICQL